MDKQASLFICWKEPKALPAGNTVILSFLSPFKEEELKGKSNCRVVSARQIVPEVKDAARQMYVELIARIGVAPAKAGKTFRQVLDNGNGSSLWWFHKVAAKDCESDPTFGFIKEILVIVLVANSIDANEVVFFGGHKEVADAVRNLFSITTIRCRRKFGFKHNSIWGCLNRVKYFSTFLGRWIAIRKTVRSVTQRSFDVVLSGFWDWSVQADRETGRLRDCYFKSLVDRLASAGLTVGWFLWLDPRKSRAKLREMLKPVAFQDSVVVLQYSIRICEAIRALVNFRQVLVLRDCCRNREFKKVFVMSGIDLFPILYPLLRYGFWDSTLPHLELVRTASQRAFSKYAPKIAFSFHEFYPYSRTFQTGGRQGQANCIHCAVQHASYSRDKTFGLLHPEIEFAGQPDNCTIPKPDYIFAMGELGREIFMGNGFPENRVLLTGSSRYEHVIQKRMLRSKKTDSTVNVLIVTSLDVQSEIEMVEAVYWAARDLTGMRLLLRSHPLAGIEQHSDFSAYAGRISLTEGTLEEDLQNADLIVFSYSTVAEEAFIRGMPVWQWCSVHGNGSIFNDLPVVPAFTSISTLRDGLIRFQQDPDSFIPDEETINHVVKKCFYAVDGNASQRIADFICTRFFSESITSVKEGV